MSHTLKCKYLILALTVMLTMNITQAHAQNAIQNSANNSYIDIIPAPSVTNNKFPTTINTPSHPPINLSPDKSELIALDSAAATIIVGNPSHLSILPSTSQGLILVGRLPGATHFIALDQNGQIIMQRHVLVAAPKENYVRVRKTCAASDDVDCQKTQVYYCPDTCHEIVIEANQNNNASSSTPDAEQSQADINNAPPPDAIDSATE